jgi:hypothetical protein
MPGQCVGHSTTKYNNNLTIIVGATSEAIIGSIAIIIATIEHMQATERPTTKSYDG